MLTTKILFCKFCGEKVGCRTGQTVYKCSTCAWRNDCERLGLANLYPSECQHYCINCTGDTENNVTSGTDVTQ